VTVRLAQRNNRDDEYSNSENGEKNTYEPLCSASPRGDRGEVNHRAEIIRRFRGVGRTAAADDSRANDVAA
jgi:hypothetical protein